MALQKNALVMAAKTSAGRRAGDAPEERVGREASISARHAFTGQTPAMRGWDPMIETAIRSTGPSGVICSNRRP